MWKSRQKHDHHFYGKIAIFFRQINVFSALKKLLKRWFHGNFWAWSRFIVLFHTVSTNYADFTEFFWKENGRSKFSAISTLCIENSEEIHFYGKFSSSETFAGTVTTSISICAISKNSCSMLRSFQNANRCSSMSKIRFCQKKCLQLENKSGLTKCRTTVRQWPFEIVNLDLVHPVVV